MDIHSKIVADVPELQRGRMWCTACLREHAVDAAKALAGGGWPECCGMAFTFKLPDPPNDQNGSE